MPRKVKMVKLYETLHVPGLGELTNTLPPTNRTIPGLVMFLQDNGTISFHTPILEAVIGVSAYKMAILEPETEAPKAS